MTYTRAQLCWVLDMGSKPWMEQSARDPFSFSPGKNGPKKKKKKDFVAMPEYWQQ
jgi:hypothetical protein